MKSSSGLLLLVSSASLASAQYTINPDNVSSSTRKAWCNDQTTQCPLICLQYPNNTAVPTANTCDYQTLTYSCVCSSGNTPNVTEYSQTIPYYICTEWGNECVNNCGQGNSACASSCRQDHPCGAQNPTRVNTSSIHPTSTGVSGSSNNAASTTSAGTIYTGLAGQAATTPGSAASSIRGTSLDLSSAWSILLVTAGVFGGFAVLL